MESNPLNTDPRQELPSTFSEVVQQADKIFTDVIINGSDEHQSLFPTPSSEQARDRVFRQLKEVIFLAYLQFRYQVSSGTNRRDIIHLDNARIAYCKKTGEYRIEEGKFRPLN